MTSDSSFFVASSSDWAANAIDNLTATAPTIWSAGLLAYNLLFLAIGGTLFLYLIVRFIVSGASHGKIGGKDTSFWFPVRFVIAIALLAPLPPNGMNAGEAIVLGSMRAGVAAGSTVWAAVVAATADMKPIVQPVTPEAKVLARNLFLIEVCREIENRTAAAPNSNAATVTEIATTTKSTLSYSYDGDPTAGGIIGQCGTITYTQPPADDQAVQTDAVVDSALAAAAPIYQVHLDAGRQLQYGLRPLATALVPQFLPPYSTTGAMPSVDVASLERAYTDAVSTAARTQITNGPNSERLEAFKNAATNGGWVRAGAWSLNLLRANETIQQAAAALPVIHTPHSEWWSGNIYVNQRAAYQAADAYWGQNYAQKPSTTDRDAFEATNNTGGGWAITSVIDVARYKSIFDTTLLGYTGDSDKDVLGTHERNPISEMSALGHNLIDAVYGSIFGFGAARAAAASIRESIQIVAVGQSSIPVTGAIVDTAAAVPAAAAAGLLEMMQSVAPIVWMILFPLLSAGIALAFFLPIIPGVVWLYAVAQYFVSGLMTALAAPVWAIAHLELEGEGLGQRAAPGYLTIFGLIAKPAIMTMGLATAMATVMIFGQLFGAVYFEMVRNSVTGSYAGITGLVFYVCLGAAIIVRLVWIAMWCVGPGTDAVMSMIGERLHSIAESHRESQNTGNSGDHIGGKAEDATRSGTLKRGSESANTASSLDENRSSQASYIARDVGDDKSIPNA